MQLSKTINAIKGMSISIRYPILLIVGLFLEIIVYLNQMLIWGRIMESLGSNLRLSSFFSGYWLSYLPRYLPGSLWGYMSRGAWLSSSFNIDLSVSLMGSIIEVIVMALSAVLFYAFSIYVNQPFMVIIYLSVLPITWLIIKKVAHLISSSNNKILKQLYGTNSLERTFSLIDWMFIFLYAFVSWLIFGFISILITFSITTFPLPILLNYFITFCGIYALSWLVGFLFVIVPSGLGIREYFLASILMTTLNVSMDVGNAISVVLRLLGFMAEFFWILVGVIVETKKNI
ncbi:hypothetical protein ATHL_03054 [Anaerolinea thermolimosa]|nr:hypothetical protein ATHL_03054 [Anaerolinea thermolimosa]